MVEKGAGQLGAMMMASGQVGASPGVPSFSRLNPYCFSGDSEKVEQEPEEAGSWRQELITGLISPRFSSQVIGFENVEARLASIPGQSQSKLIKPNQGIRFMSGEVVKMCSGSVDIRVT